MFTGLVESVGSILDIQKIGGQARFVLSLPFANELALGESVAVNGCCLTVAELHENGACFDLLAQTLKVTSLGDLVVGSLVNLERAMQVGARFGGHYVQGHVDVTGKIEKIRLEGQDHVLTVSLPPEIESLCVDKGSICIDGISLTIAELTLKTAIFWITPHTWEHTHLSAATEGQVVNLEADILAKYVSKLLDTRQNKA